MHKVAGAHEWVGGRVTAPFYVTEPEPYRPEMILWLELPEDLIVASTLLDPEGPPVSFGDTLLDAMASPLAGPPRRPARLRVADARLAAEVREAVPDVEVVVAPTPELDRILQLMAESAPPEDEIDLSYFEGGGIPTQTIASLFGAAQLLFRVAPWKVADDSQLLRLDIPAFGVEGACLSIIGALGESLGFILRAVPGRRRGGVRPRRGRGSGHLHPVSQLRARRGSAGLDAQGGGQARVASGRCHRLSVGPAP